MRQRFGDRYPDIEGTTSIPEIAGLHLGRGVVLRDECELLLPKARDGAAQASISLGDRVKVGRRVQLGGFAGSSMRVGDDTSFQSGCVIIGDVNIGTNCLFSLHVFISSGNHFSELRPHWFIRDQDRLALSDPEFAADRSAPVTVEDDCWLGWGTIIKRGVYVGKGAVIGSYSVVTKDVAPYSIQAGAPSRELRKRFDFRPGASVCASNDEDHPYFYSGFLLRRDDLVIAAAKSAVKLRGARGRILFADDQFARVRITGALEQDVNALRCTLRWNGQQIYSAVITDGEFDVGADIPPAAQTEAAREALPSPLRTYNELTIEIDQVTLVRGGVSIERPENRPPGAADSTPYLRIYACRCDRQPNPRDDVAK